MARYIEVAKDANNTIRKIVNRNPAITAEDIADMVYLYNLGIKTAPRPVQSTVRINACKEAAASFPVIVSSQKKFDEKTGKEFTAIQIGVR